MVFNLALSAAGANTEFLNAFNVPTGPVAARSPGQFSRLVVPRNDSSVPTVNLFIDAAYSSAQYAASVVDACKDQTTYALRCTSGPSFVGTATCGPNAPVSPPALTIHNPFQSHPPCKYHTNIILRLPRFSPSQKAPPSTVSPQRRSPGQPATTSRQRRRKPASCGEPRWPFALRRLAGRLTRPRPRPRSRRPSRDRITTALMLPLPAVLRS